MMGSSGNKMREYKNADWYDGSWHRASQGNGRHSVELLQHFPPPTLSSSSAIRNGQNVTLNIDSWSYAVAAIPSATLGDVQNSNVTYGYGSVPTSPSTSTDAPYIAWGSSVVFDGNVPIQKTGAGVISGGTVQVSVHLTVNISYQLNGTQHEVWQYFWVQNVDFDKVACNDASIDTRRMYGQPDQDGGTPGNDPNADLRNVNFGAWTYRGGLFLGFKNPMESGYDQSGIARIQLYAGSLPSFTTLQAGCLSLYDLGRGGRPETGFPSLELTVGLYAVANSPSTSETTAVWSQRWPLKEFDNLTSNLTPVDQLAFSSSEHLDYEFWQLKDANNNLPSAGISYLALAQTSEPNPGDLWSMGSTGSTWCYFASREYQSDHDSAFPENDSAPRLWLAVPGTSTSWSTGP